MKTTIKSVFILALALATASFTTTMKKTIDTSASQIDWVGKKITGKHTGTLQFSEGYLEMEGDQITGGKFVVDMTSLEVTDLKGDSKAKLEGHLTSDDFFGIANHPTATLVIKNGTKTDNGYYVNGELTIKGTTEPIAFELNMNGNTATAAFEVDRTKFNVRYGSGSFFDNLGDNTIYDDFELTVNLKFQ
ncbi:YceI family protein [Croceiramulus getboli]|nr:YceI family protein [Flavobacteriaceae bacterium YJPT1-3]